MNSEGQKCGKVCTEDEEKVTSFIDGAASKRVILRVVGKRKYHPKGKSVGEL